MEKLDEDWKNIPPELLQQASTRKRKISDVVNITTFKPSKKNKLEDTPEKKRPDEIVQKSEILDSKKKIMEKKVVEKKEVEKDVEIEKGKEKDSKTKIVTSSKYNIAYVSTLNTSNATNNVKSSSSKSSLKPIDVNVNEIKVGIQVDANFNGKGKWYRGTVMKVYPNSTADIEFEDGDKEFKVLFNNIRVIGQKEKIFFPSPPRSKKRSNDDHSGKHVEDINVNADDKNLKATKALVKGKVKKEDKDTENNKDEENKKEMERKREDEKKKVVEKKKEDEKKKEVEKEREDEKKNKIEKKKNGKEKDVEKKGVEKKEEEDKRKEEEKKEEEEKKKEEEKKNEDEINKEEVEKKKEAEKIELDWKREEEKKKEIQNKKEGKKMDLQKKSSENKSSEKLEAVSDNKEEEKKIENKIEEAKVERVNESNEKNVQEETLGHKATSKEKEVVFKWPREDEKEKLSNPLRCVQTLPSLPSLAILLQSVQVALGLQDFTLAQLENSLLNTDNSHLLNVVITRILISNEERNVLQAGLIYPYSEWNPKLKAHFDVLYDELKRYRDYLLSLEKLSGDMKQARVNNGEEASAAEIAVEKDCEKFKLEIKLKERILSPLGNTNPLIDTSFVHLNFDLKAKVLIVLCEWQVYHRNEFYDSVCAKNVTLLRPQLIGKDDDDNCYYKLGGFENDFRVYVIPAANKIISNAFATSTVAEETLGSGNTSLWFIVAANVEEINSFSDLLKNTGRGRDANLVKSFSALVKHYNAMQDITKQTEMKEKENKKKDKDILITDKKLEQSILSGNEMKKRDAERKREAVVGIENSNFLNNNNTELNSDLQMAVEGMLGVGTPKGGDVYCICRGPEGTGLMLGCDICEEWYHALCIGIARDDMVTPSMAFQCHKCSESKKFILNGMSVDDYLKHTLADIKKEKEMEEKRVKERALKDQARINAEAARRQNIPIANKPAANMLGDIDIDSLNHEQRDALILKVYHVIASQPRNEAENQYKEALVAQVQNNPYLLQSLRMMAMSVQNMQIQQERILQAQMQMQAQSSQMNPAALQHMQQQLQAAMGGQISPAVMQQYQQQMQQQLQHQQMHQPPSMMRHSMMPSPAAHTQPMYNMTPHPGMMIQSGSFPITMNSTPYVTNTNINSKNSMEVEEKEAEL